MSEQPLPRRGVGAGRVMLYAAAAVALLLIGVALGRSSVSGTGTSTGTSTQSSAAYCTSLKTLSADLTASQGDAGKTGTPNAYAAAELRDAGPIYDAASSSSDPRAVRALALALTLEGQAREQPGIDPGLLGKIEGDTDNAVKAAPGC